MPSTTTHVTAGTLAALAGLHLGWGQGSSFPFATRDELADAVIGTTQVPGPMACYAVATALLTAAAVLEGHPRLPTGIRRLGLSAIAGVLGLRGGLGLAGMTEVISPGSSSRRFKRLDRRVYSPLCLSLAIGTVLSGPRRGR